MHELPATQGMLAVALEAAEGAGGGPVRAIDVVVGELGSMVDESVRFYFEILSRGTPAEGAELRLRRVPGRGECLECGHRWAARPPLAAECPSCAGLLLRVSGGQEFFVESIEVDDDDGAGGDQDPEGQRPGGGREP